MRSGTATHVVCPICGKSSSLKSFPAGPGTDIVLQTFQSLGRGRGFAVRDRTSGLADGALCGAVVPKLLASLTVLGEHGHLDPASVVAALGDLAPTAPDANEFEALKARASRIESELRAERDARHAFERARKELSATLAAEREKVQDLVVRVAGLEQRLGVAEDARVNLVSASRGALTALQSLRPAVRDVPTAKDPMAALIAGLRKVALSTQELGGATRGRGSGHG